MFLFFFLPCYLGFRIFSRLIAFKVLTQKIPNLHHCTLAVLFFSSG